MQDRGSDAFKSFFLLELNENYSKAIEYLKTFSKGLNNFFFN